MSLPSQSPTRGAPLADGAPMVDADLEFAAAALQMRLIDRRQFLDACHARGDGSMADSLVARGWLSEAERTSVQTQIELEATRRAEGEPDNNHETLTLSPTESIAASSGLARSPLAVRERITLRGLHSSGGIGEVWRAHDRVLDREVALKRLKAQQARSPANRARFRREAQITGSLDHPGIVPVYDYVATDDGTPFFTMRFLRGRTLADVIRTVHDARTSEGQPLVGPALFELLDHFSSVCNTVAFAHSRAIIHRDIKAENVIVGDYGDVIVLDWGLAKRVSEADVVDEVTPALTLGGTLQGELLGTPPHMAPEQALGHNDRVDYRTDVYGLAALLYQVLTGEAAFTGDDAKAILRAVIERPPTPPSVRVAGVPEALERACLRGLAKDPDARQQSVRELAEEVREWRTALIQQRRSELERMRFFELSVDLLAIVGRDGTLVQCNPAWARVLGAPATQGAALATRVADDDRERLAAHLGQVWSGASHAEFELRMDHADGRPRWVHWIATALPNEPALYLVGRDVSDRKASELELQGVLESAPEAMVVVDARGEIVRVNTALERLFDLPRDRLLGQPLETLLPERLHEAHASHVAAYWANPRARPMGTGLTLEARRADGTSIPVEVSLSPVETPDRKLICASIRVVRW